MSKMALVRIGACLSRFAGISLQPPQPGASRKVGAARASIRLLALVHPRPERRHRQICPPSCVGLPDSEEPVLVDGVRAWGRRAVAGRGGVDPALKVGAEELRRERDDGQQVRLGHNLHPAAGRAANRSLAHRVTKWNRRRLTSAISPFFSAAANHAASFSTATLSAGAPPSLTLATTARHVSALHTLFSPNTPACQHTPRTAPQIQS